MVMSKRVKKNINGIIEYSYHYFMIFLIQHKYKRMWEYWEEIYKIHSEYLILYHV